MNCIYMYVYFYSGMAEDMFHLAVLFDDEDFFLLSASLYEEQEQIAERKEERSVRFNFAAITDGASWEMFRFRKEYIVLLKQHLRITDLVKLEWSEFSGLDVLCVFLKRLAYPCRLSDLSIFFGRSESDLSRVIAYVLNHISVNFSHLLQDLNQPYLSVKNLQTFANSIKNKGCPLDYCWGFIDGIVFPICRPKQHQRQLFSGHKRVHCLKFQSVMCPNGIISSFMGSYVGHRHDAGIFHESKITEQLQTKQNADGNIFLHFWG